jgi:hypothetical protein
MPAKAKAKPKKVAKAKPLKVIAPAPAEPEVERITGKQLALWFQYNNHGVWIATAPSDSPKSAGHFLKENQFAVFAVPIHRLCLDKPWPCEVNVERLPSAAVGSRGYSHSEGTLVTITDDRIKPGAIVPPDPDKDPLREQIEVMQAVVDFYCLLLAEPLYKPDLAIGRGQVFARQWERVVPTLARAFFDYTAITCFTEMRHGEYRCEMKYEELEMHVKKNRHYAVHGALHYEPKSILKAAKVLFDYDWESGFGGRSWKKIAEGGLLYQTVPDMVFIDHAVDLTHNNGAYIDKGIIFANDYGHGRYTNFLDTKRNAKTAKEVIDYIRMNHLPVSQGLLPMLVRLVGEDLVSLIRLQDIRSNWYYDEPKWGDAPFELKPVPSDHYGADSDDNDDDSGDESEEVNEEVEVKEVRHEPEAEEAPAREKAEI